MIENSLLLVAFSYLLLLLIISFVSSRGNISDNAFFLANRKSPWWIVAIGMVGSSLSGISFVSVPGMVGSIGFSYMQTVLGFSVGYVVIAQILLPLYYKLNLTTIYTYLGERLGTKSHKTGAWFFFISKLIGAAVRLYVIAIILQNFVFSAWNIPFWITVCVIVLVIWLYTFRSGIKTIIWTDTLQTLFLLTTLVLILIKTWQKIDLPLAELISGIAEGIDTRMFTFNDWHSKQNFFKQFFSGIFIAIVMTGLDQDMMQKNLSCKTLKDAQKNMYWYGLSFIPVNLLFLCLGVLLLFLAQQQNIALPALSDNILPVFATQYLGEGVAALFLLGILAAAFSSADSALTALTTSFVVDILNNNAKTVGKKKRTYVHFAISVTFAWFILIFHALNGTSLINAIYVIVSYTYGPLLGMFAFGLFTKQNVNDKFVPYIAIASPFVCYALDTLFTHVLGYAFGYELLMINGMLTFVGLWIISKNNQIIKK